jgi:hypothetical protein
MAREVADLYIMMLAQVMVAHSSTLLSVSFQQPVHSSVTVRSYTLNVLLPLRRVW